MGRYIVTANDFDGIQDPNIISYLYLAQGVLISNPVLDQEVATIAIQLGDYSDVFIYGAVQGGNGIVLGDGLVPGGIGSYLNIGSTGTISASAENGVVVNGFGVAMYGSNNTLVNAGSIASNNIGVVIFGGGNVYNSGTISSKFGLLVSSDPDSVDASNISIVNSGRIIGNNSNGGFATGITFADANNVGNIVSITNTGEVTGVDAHDANTFTEVTLTNTGVIVGPIDLGQGNDVLDNRNGEILGNVYLGNGADVFRNANGLVTGTINGDIGNAIEGGNDSFYGGTTDEIIRGNGGNDVIRGGAGDDELFGDDGNDTLRGQEGFDTLDGGLGNDFASYFFDGAIVLALDGSLISSGAVTNDTLISIESISGSNIGADTLVGDDQDNKLYGNGGVDTLTGNVGNDTLRGGAGADIMNGNAGADTYQYTATTEGGDQVGSFSSIDFFAFKSSAFGGLAVGGLDSTAFQSRANDNLAQDTNDRFIFRVSDATLWYDSNGSTGGASNAILIADITVAATVTAGDISIFA
jgi:Ca2+-binding RTX toxin-like protein